MVLLSPCKPGFRGLWTGLVGYSGCVGGALAGGAQRLGKGGPKARPFTCITNT